MRRDAWRFALVAGIAVVVAFLMVGDLTRTVRERDAARDSLRTMRAEMLAVDTTMFLVPLRETNPPRWRYVRVRIVNDTTERMVQLRPGRQP